MDIHAYISSGILESYVLGELPAAEARQVEEMALRYPEVQQELHLIENTLHAVIEAAAVPPRPELKARLFDRLPPQAAPQQKVPEQSAPVRPQQETPAAPLQRQGFPWLLAASIALALISSVAAVVFWSRWQESEARLAVLESQNSVLAQQVSTLENRTAPMQQTLAVLADPAFTPVPMKGLAPAPEAQAVVFWNPTNAEVYLNAGSLPPAPAGKQYQLWAIVDGQPVDAGVFDAGAQALVKMREIENASAFAVTLEPAGGSPTPTLDQMYVLGEAS